MSNSRRLKKPDHLSTPQAERLLLLLIEEIDKIPDDDGLNHLGLTDKQVEAAWWRFKARLVSAGKLRAEA